MAKEYNITRASGRCTACEREIEPGEEFIATVRPAPEDAEEEFARADYCPACWEAGGEAKAADPALLGVWRSRVPTPKEKRKTSIEWSRRRRRPTQAKAATRTRSSYWTSLGRWNHQGPPTLWIECWCHQ